MGFTKENKFRSDPPKQAQEVIFSRRIKQISLPPPFFNYNSVNSTSTQKHLEMVSDAKLDFKIHKTIGFLCKIYITLVRSSLITLYRSFIRPHLDHGDIIYDQAHINSSQKK